MLNPGQMLKNQQGTIPHIRNSTHIFLDAFQNTSKSKWDEPISIPPILYSKFNVPLPMIIKQIKQYPKSLLDYIRRAYEKCKDDTQRNSVERQLREIVRNFESNYCEINWQSYPLPNIYNDSFELKPAIIKREQKPNIVTTSAVKIKLNEIKLLSCYNIVEEEKPSKAWEIAKKRTEKLQEKLNKIGYENCGDENGNKRQFFIGFSNMPLDNKCRKNQEQVNTNVSNSATINGIKNYQNRCLPQKLQIKEKPVVIKIQVEKQRQRQRQKQPQKEKQKQKQKQKEKLPKKQTQKQKKETIQKEQRKVSKKELHMIQKLKQSDQQINQVAKRFKGFNKIKLEHHQRDLNVDGEQDIDLDDIIVGKSQSIEKPYLRITGRPNPETVRPEPVLKKALKFFINKYDKDNNYQYFISQVRSIRQDLTVQHIKNGFTVQVYEENLQISLSAKDIPQFKHCQTTLWQLYCQGHYYTRQSRNKYIAHQMTTLIMEDKSQEMELMLTRIPQGSLETPQIQQCLRLQRKLIMGNYRYFFDYRKEQSKFFKGLLDLYSEKIYLRFMLMICKTCGQKVPMAQLCKLLGDNQLTLENIIRQEGAIIDNGFIMLKQSYEQLVKSQHLGNKKVTVLMD